eukprot:TRINITY_DN12782_c0_g1_i2.p1 TRINITY_DN12782_c0_g1~~TRINITY_DN12782_c0_g1_i2.p1  ORF type:complete len:179 (-),score=28.53 TRINITY_DN12782_c0_g1_i2:121-657(-)
MRSCEGFPQGINLAMKTYLYSFEFEDVAYYPTYRASVWTHNRSDRIFRKSFPSRFNRISDHIIHDAGWHCSWCFKYISDFTWKMRAYSHSDQFWRKEQYTREYIQDVICTGKRLQGRYWVDEASSYEQLFARLAPITPVFSLVGLPEILKENFEEFYFLLPGNCQREISRQHTFQSDV